MNDNDPAYADCIRWKCVKQLVVPGQPVGKGRPRFYKRGRYTKVFTPEKTLKFEKRVAVFCQGKMLPAGEPIRIRMRFIFKRPKRLMRRKDPDWLIPHMSKPDGDNVEKAILDGLSGVAYHDDSQVFGGSWTKWYAEKKRGPRVEINIYIPEPTTQRNE